MKNHMNEMLEHESKDLIQQYYACLHALLHQDKGLQGPSTPPTLLGEDGDGGEVGRVMWCTLPRRERGDPW